MFLYNNALSDCTALVNDDNDDDDDDDDNDEDGTIMQDFAVMVFLLVLFVLHVMVRI